jgi:hypothetical protein
MSRKAARDSAARGVTPLLFEAEDLADDATVREHSRGIPFIGDRIPRGWKHIKAGDVPAFAIREAGAGYAYAIVEAGQFQVVIAIFKSKG